MEHPKDQALKQPWKAWYQPATVAKSDLSFVWPISLAAFASGNGAKSMIRDVDFEKPKERKCKDPVVEEGQRFE